MGYIGHQLYSVHFVTNRDWYEDERSLALSFNRLIIIIFKTCQISAIFFISVPQQHVNELIAWNDNKIASYEKKKKKRTT